MFCFAFLLAVAVARGSCQVLEDDCPTHQVPHGIVSLLQTSVSIERLEQREHSNSSSLSSENHSSLDAVVAGKDESLVSAGKSVVDGKCGHFSYFGGHVPQAAKVLVGVVTYSGNQKTKAIHAFLQQRLSQAQLQESFSVQYFSNASVYGLPSWCDNHKTSSYADAQERFLRMLYHIFNGCMKTTFDWFMQLDDDAMFDPQRLLSFVNQAEHAVPDVDTHPMVFARNASSCVPYPSDQVPPVGTTDFTLLERLGCRGAPLAFGGNGLLYSAASLQVLKKYAGAKWPSIYNANWNSTKYDRWFENRLFLLLHNLQFPCANMFHYPPYGFGVGQSVTGSWDQIAHLPKDWMGGGSDSNKDERLAAFTLHKIRNQADMELASSIFESPPACPSIGCSSVYGSLLEGFKFVKCS